MKMKFRGRHGCILLKTLKIDGAVIPWFTCYLMIVILCRI